MRPQGSVAHRKPRWRRTVWAKLALEQLKCFRCPLRDQGALEFSEDRAELCHGSTLRCAEINPVGDTHQADGAGREAPKVRERLGSVASKTIEPDKYNRIDTRPPGVEQRRDLRSAKPISEPPPTAYARVLDNISKHQPCHSHHEAILFRCASRLKPSVACSIDEHRTYPSTRIPATTARIISRRRKSLSLIQTR